MNRKKVNTGAAAASSCSQFFHFPSSLAWIGVYLFGVASRKVVCEIRVVLVRVRGFSAALKRSLSFFRLLCFPWRSNRGAVLLRWASGRCGFTACSHTRRALCTGKSPRRRPTFINEVKELQSEIDADERQSQQIAAAGRQRIIDRSTRQTVLSKKPFGFSESTARLMNRP